MLKNEYFLTFVGFNRVSGVKPRMYYSNLADIRLPDVPQKLQQVFVEKRKPALTLIAGTEKTSKRVNLKSQKGSSGLFRCREHKWLRSRRSIEFEEYFA